MAAGASDDQQADKQHLAPSDIQASNSKTLLPDYSSAATTADSITFHTPPTGRSSSPAKTTFTSPDPFAPPTPDHMPALPMCKVNPMSDFHNVIASRDPSNDEAALSSFQELLGSKDVDQQERLSKFQQLLASQEVDEGGEPLSGLAGRVRTMAAQLDALQKRTQVRPVQLRSIQKCFQKYSTIVLK